MNTVTSKEGLTRKTLKNKEPVKTVLLRESKREKNNLQKKKTIVRGNERIEKR